MKRNEKEILAKSIADKHNKSSKEVNEVVDSSWDFIRETIVGLDLYIPTEDLEDLKMNFNIPSLGKLYVNKDKHKYKVKKLRKNYEE